jgi:hypothetical protein
MTVAHLTLVTSSIRFAGGRIEVRHGLLTFSGDANAKAKSQS